MNFIMQTKFGPEGNCFDACLATLLGEELEAVNYFRDEGNWYQDLQHWLAPRGLAYVEIEPIPRFYYFHLPVMVIAGGPSPRGVEGGHAVIAKLHGWEKTIIHDPHPSADGLVEIESIGFLVWTPQNRKHEMREVE